MLALVVYVAQNALRNKQLTRQKCCLEPTRDNRVGGNGLSLDEQNGADINATSSPHSVSTVSVDSKTTQTKVKIWQYYLRPIKLRSEMHLLVTILLASGVTSLKCIQCGGHGMAPCDKMRGSMMAIECPASSLRSVSSCYVGVEDTGAVRRDCLTLSSQTVELEGNAMSSLLNAPSVQRDFGFEWDQVGESTGVIRFNKQATGAPMRAALTSQSMCLALCDDDDKCNAQLALPECSGNKRQKRDLFLTYSSLGEWEESLMTKQMAEMWPEFSEEYLQLNPAINAEVRMMTREKLDVPTEFMLSKLAHTLNNEQDLDRVHIKGFLSFGCSSLKLVLLLSSNTRGKRHQRVPQPVHRSLFPLSPWWRQSTETVGAFKNTSQVLLPMGTQFRQ